MSRLRHYIDAIRYRIMSPIDYARHIGVTIGKECTIDTKKWPTEPYLITIGDYVRIAKGTSFYTHGGLVSLRKYYNDDDIDQFGKISIGDYSYVGENCMIMQNWQELSCGRRKCCDKVCSRWMHGSRESCKVYWLYRSFLQEGKRNE